LLWSSTIHSFFAFSVFFFFSLVDGLFCLLTGLAWLGLLLCMREEEKVRCDESTYLCIYDMALEGEELNSKRKKSLCEAC